ncbi:Translocation protein SEC62 [Operophtera brumata]|uniref:Translocation protein SEC62 n=1 Tax=Operophtera brumata TaxID=104452 RepID=A0A0L7L1U2_OPEBR|nr:Translocation protein SEC62 [Operophtera brumata]
MEQVFLDTPNAYVWIYDPMPWYYWVCGALIVFGTIGVCMFPLWPATVSIAAAAFLVLIIALTVLRVVVFCLVWMLTLSRHHLWLLPNLTEDYEYRGPGSDADKSSKNKKKRKKDKLSGDETPVLDKPTASESDSENSQRSSTDRDFEMVDPGDLEPDKDT